MKLAKHNETILCINKEAFLHTLQCYDTAFEESTTADGAAIKLVPLRLVINAIEETYVWCRRADAEVDESLWQVLPYVAICNPAGEFLTYSRDPQAAEAAGESLGEPALYNNSSIGFGGHIELADAVQVIPTHGGKFFQQTERSITAIIRENLGRELAEELNASKLSEAIMNVLALHFQDPHEPNARRTAVELVQNRAEYVGLVIDQTNAVGRVHLGLLHVVQLFGDHQLTTAEAGLPLFGFLDLGQLQSQDNLENWSRMVVNLFATERYATKRLVPTDLWCREEDQEEVTPFNVSSLYGRPENFTMNFPETICGRPQVVIIEEIELCSIATAKRQTSTMLGIKAELAHQHVELNEWNGWESRIDLTQSFVEAGLEDISHPIMMILRRNSTDEYSVSFVHGADSRPKYDLAVTRIVGRIIHR